MEWQPIETAPDKGRFLIWLRDEGFSVFASYRILERDTPEEYRAMWIWEMDCSADWHDPSHWKPEPDPPQPE